MKKILILIFYIICITSLFGQGDRNRKLDMEWENAIYDSAVVYLYGLHRGYAEFIIDEKTLSLDTTVLHSMTKTLNKEVSDSIISLLNKAPIKDTSGIVIKVLCWKPHHGIVYYKSGMPTSALSICFLCEKHVGMPKTPYKDNEIENLRKIILDLGLPVFENLNEALEYGEN